MSHRGKTTTKQLRLEKETTYTNICNLLGNLSLLIRHDKIMSGLDGRKAHTHRCIQETF